MVTSGRSNSILNSAGATVLTQGSSASTINSASGTASQAIQNPVASAASLLVGQTLSLGSGYSVTYVSDTEISWTGPGTGNTGTVTLSGTSVIVSTNGKTATIGTVSADANSRRSTRDHGLVVPAMSCWVAGAFLAAAVVGLIFAVAAAGLQLGLDPIADAGVWAAYAGVIGANWAYQSAGC